MCENVTYHLKICQLKRNLNNIIMYIPGMEVTMARGPSYSLNFTSHFILKKLVFIGILIISLLNIKLKKG